MTTLLAVWFAVIAANASPGDSPAVGGDCALRGQRRSYPPVPPTAPDSAPTALWKGIIADSNLIGGGPDVGGTIIRDLVYVQFRQGVSQVNRQATIDGIDGEVIGGMRVGGPEFFYAVRIPYCLTAGERLDAPVVRARAALRRSPHVQRAIVASMDSPVPLSRSGT